MVFGISISASQLRGFSLCCPVCDRVGNRGPSFFVSGIFLGVLFSSLFCALCSCRGPRSFIYLLSRGANMVKRLQRV